mmetsp:Transcript_45258/g.70960  ORF Transcript_45258/g.70960 Transcript_45258/m.70960 type:complete len:164 (+) Transcript_45258:251-742(+)
MRTCAGKIIPGEFARIDHELHGKKVYCYVVSKVNGIAGCLITDDKYPERVAFDVVDNFLDEYQDSCGGKWPQSNTDNCAVFPELELVMEQYQDPASVDNIERIKGDIAESKQIMQKSLDTLLERGQKIEDLLMHSTKLSMQTKMMYKSATAQPGWFDDCCGLT